MKKIARFLIRVILLVVALVAIAPMLLIISEGNTLLPNFIGLAYVFSLILIYKIEGNDGYLHKIIDIYRIAFGKFFDL